MPSVSQTSIVIPARLHSSRLDKKLLRLIEKKTVIQHVYENAQKVCDIAGVYIATDSHEIFEACCSFTDTVIMTSSVHRSGTDRLVEAMEHIPSEIILNVQGDEPFIAPKLISSLAKLMQQTEVPIASAMQPFVNQEEARSQHNVKVVVDKDENALYFSRSLVPFDREGLTNVEYLHHIGIYAYRRSFLKLYASWEVGILENIEKLEQLRILENGYRIRMMRSPRYFSLGIDTQEDLDKAREHWKTLNDRPA